MVPKCLGAELSGHFGTSAEVSSGHFGTGTEVSWVRSVRLPCLGLFVTMRSCNGHCMHALRGVNGPERTGTAFRLALLPPERRSCSVLTCYRNAVQPTEQKLRERSGWRSVSTSRTIKIMRFVRLISRSPLLTGSHHYMQMTSRCCVLRRMLRRA